MELTMVQKAAKIIKKNEASPLPEETVEKKPSVSKMHMIAIITVKIQAFLLLFQTFLENIFKNNKKARNIDVNNNFVRFEMNS